MNQIAFFLHFESLHIVWETNDIVIVGERYGHVSTFLSLASVLHQGTNFYFLHLKYIFTVIFWDFTQPFFLYPIFKLPEVWPADLNPRRPILSSDQAPARIAKFLNLFHTSLEKETQQKRLHSWSLRVMRMNYSAGMTSSVHIRLQ